MREWSDYIDEEDDAHYKEFELPYEDYDEKLERYKREWRRELDEDLDRGN